jgi:putative hydrolase of the HAD superfamily
MRARQASTPRPVRHGGIVQVSLERSPPLTVALQRTPGLRRSSCACYRAPMLDWDRIDTVLLDMDGTVLDLHFDSRFWLHLVPTAYGEARGLSRDQAWSELEPRLKRVEGTLQWYCLDYWSRELQLDVAQMKHELAHLIRFRDDAEAFLRRLRSSHRQVVLVTNAHQRSLSLKVARTGLDSLLDATVTSHELGYPKECAHFWPRLRERHPFEPHRTLFLDDSLPVLRAAHRYGIAHLLSIHQPDSSAPGRHTEEFQSLEHFADIMPA